MPHHPLPRGLPTTFLLHFMISAVVGLQHVFAPRVWTDLTGFAAAFSAFTLRMRTSP